MARFMSNAHLVAPPRGIDHLVIAATDLDRLAETYRNLGFQVGAKNRHGWGTANHIVQFNGCFLELIGVAEPGLIPEAEGHRYSFGAFVRDYLKGGEGAAMLALESRNAVADAVEFRRDHIGDFEPFYFERQGLGADGQPRRVSFSLAFAKMKDAPRAGFFTCQQHQPQNFWDKAKQQHDNGATGIASIVLVADDPSDDHIFLDHFIGQREMRATSFGIELDTGRGLVEVLSPQAFRFRFGQPAPITPGAGTQFAAAVFQRPDARKAHTNDGSAGVHREQLNVVSAEKAGGVVLAFAG